MATIQVGNRLFELPEDVSPEGIVVEYVTSKPAWYSNTDHGLDIGRDVHSLEEGVYLVNVYDHSNRRPNYDNYTIVVTQPEVVGIPIETFSPREQAFYEIAKIVRQVTGKTVSSKWKIHVMEILPEIEYNSISTPANTSNVSWGGQKISNTIVLKTVDGWTGSRDDTKRELYVLKSAFPALAS